MSRRHPWSLFALGCLGWVGSWAMPVQAAPPETAPAALVTALADLESAANARNLDEVMAFYSPSFTNDDGFTHDSLRADLSTLWEQYKTLTYDIELQSWDETPNGYTVETVTHIDGNRLSPRAMTLDAVIRSRQYFENGQITAQEILSERNQLSSGNAPPTVTVILPERVTPGESYGFDAIVQEPLGDRYLLGAALDEGTTAEDFFTPRPIELELLSAGGLFKVGEAPAESDNMWVSGLLIRNDGLLVITRRLRVE